MRILTFLSHPIWTGVSALVAIVALFWRMGIAREVDRVTYPLWSQEEQNGQATGTQPPAIGDSKQ